MRARLKSWWIMAGVVVLVATFAEKSSEVAHPGYRARTPRARGRLVHAEHYLSDLKFEAVQRHIIA